MAITFIKLFSSKNRNVSTLLVILLAVRTVRRPMLVNIKPSMTLPRVHYNTIRKRFTIVYLCAGYPQIRRNSNTQNYSYNKIRFIEFSSDVADKGFEMI